LAIGLLPGVVTEPAPHFIHTVVVQGVAFVYPGIAVSTIATTLSRHRGRPVQTWVAAALVLWLIGNSCWTFFDYFQRWPELEQVRDFHQADLASIAHYLDRSAETTPVTICTAFLNEQDPFWRTGRQAMPFLLNRRDLAIRWYNCQDSQVWPLSGSLARHFFPGGTSFSAWVPSEWLTPGRSLENSSAVRNSLLDVSQPLAARLIGLRSHSEPELTIPVHFGEQLGFLGYEMSTDQVQPGGNIKLYTYWQVATPLPPNLAIFVHFLQEPATLLAQGDALSLLSDTLQPGDVFIQQHTLSIPLATSEGCYQVAMGTYSRTGAQSRQQVIVAGQPWGDRLLLGSLSVIE
jgi:hypothetical protein